MSVTTMQIQKIKSIVGIETGTIEVASGVQIYEGTIVTKNSSGLATAGVTSDLAMGIAQHDASEGELVTFWLQGTWELPIASYTPALLGTTLYVVDNFTVGTGSVNAIAGICIGGTPTTARCFFTTRE